MPKIHPCTISVGAHMGLKFWHCSLVLQTLFCKMSCYGCKSRCKKAEVSVSVFDLRFTTRFTQGSLIFILNFFSYPILTLQMDWILFWQTQKLITEISSLEKEVTHLEHHVLNLYRKVLDQRLPEQRRVLQGRYSEPSSPCSHAERKHAMAGDSRFKLEKKFPRDASPQHQRHAAVAQGSKRPHSAISNDPLKTRHSSLLGGTFYAIDEEPREMQDFSGELPSVSSKCHANSCISKPFKTKGAWFLIGLIWLIIL